MDLNQLRNFITVAELNSLTKAADQLFISQSALSMSISRLETELGTKLFNRTKNSMSLNDAGKTTLKTAESIVGSWTDLVENLQKNNSYEEQNLLIGWTERGPLLFADYYLRKHFPIRTLKYVKFNEEQVSSMLLSGEADFAFSSRTHDDPDTGISSLWLGQTQLKVAVPKGHQLDSREFIDFEDLNGVSLVFYETSAKIGDAVLCHIKEKQVHPQISLVSDDLLYGRMLNSNKNAFTFMTNLAETYLNDNRYVLLPLRGFDFSHDIYLSFLTDNAGRYKSVIEYLKHQFSKTQ